MPEMAARLADHGAELEINGLEVRLDPAAAVRRQGIEQLIAPQIAIGLRLDHSKTDKPR
ncbi:MULTISPECIES: hypothetical protein [unclassified Bradyrhizobium]|uniref:hypothetical protein n=1 Tax=unclassified Bradyrhizobium TaxID=2631580 RepID=UPI0028EFA0CE|nr:MULTISPECIES: hypothetical protein [unclassified Bradyrhizobium]